MATNGPETPEGGTSPLQPVPAEGKPARAGAGSIFVTIIRGFGVVLAFFLMLVSVPLFLLPIPLGVPIFVAALVLLALVSRTAHGRITSYIKRHPTIWEKVRRVFRE